MTEGAVSKASTESTSTALLRTCHRSASSSTVRAVHSALNAKNTAGMTTLAPTALSAGINQRPMDSAQRWFQ